MFFKNKKLDPNLKKYIDFNPNVKYRVIIKYKKFKDNIIRKVNSYSGEFINAVEHSKIITARMNSRGIKRLIEYPEVEFISFDEYLFLCGTSVTTANKARISTKSKLKGTGISIAIIDSGVYPHPDLISPNNRIIKFVDLINGLNYPYDDNGHGTCIAGIISGNGNNSNGTYRGIATNSNIISYKAFDKTGKGYISDILYSIDMIINEAEKTNTKIICMPFEMLNYNSFLQKLFHEMVSKAITQNITCIVPSGSNKNLDGSITGIALCNDCITVSGYDSTFKPMPRSYTYSSVGPYKKSNKPNFCAACVDIVSLNSNTNYISERNGIKLYPPKLNSSYKTFTGTSLAAAYVAGICALIYEYNTTLTPRDILSLLELSCEKLDMPDNCQGNGRININNIFKTDK
ncbi:MAG: S8 family serine peptidase [Clostridiales bacterium]|nr:S8 family serine peptidase [Clostridiales bacterium]